MRLADFVQQYGQPFSEMLGISLTSRKSEEISKWFLASMLYSKPIRESTATTTYQVFEESEVLSPKEILKTGWEGLVSLLDEGGYTRYDFSTASKLLQVFGNLQKNYSGDLNRLHDAAVNSDDLVKRLRDLGKGIGATTVSIFLRDMRGIWPKADPEPSPLVRLAMRELGIKDIKRLAQEKGVDTRWLETALLRLGKDFIKRGKKLEFRLDRGTGKTR